MRIEYLEKVNGILCYLYHEEELLTEMFVPLDWWEQRFEIFKPYGVLWVDLSKEQESDMAGRKSTTNLTFSLTIEQPAGATIPEVRAFIKESLRRQQKATNPESTFQDIDVSDIKCHLTNKETSYGRG